MSSMFDGCSSLTELNISNWDTSAVTDMGWMFARCSSLTELNLSGWDISSVMNMGAMFDECINLQSLDASGWDTSNVKIWTGYFWVSGNELQENNIFNNCASLAKIKYSQKALSLIEQLPMKEGWYQDNKGPYNISNLPAVPSGKTALLTRSKSPDSQKPDDSQKPSTETVKPVSMHRLYNPNSGEHFYTAADNEKNHLVSVGWKYEGEGWKAPEKSNAPVYRLYNPNAGDHHYTLDEKEKEALIKLGWNYEGIGWYSDENKAVPLYREYNPNAKAGSHNYTPNKNEHDHLTSIGWKDEGIAWYGLK